MYRYISFSLVFTNGLLISYLLDNYRKVDFEKISIEDIIN